MRAFAYAGSVAQHPDGHNLARFDRDEWRGRHSDGIGIGADDDRGMARELGQQLARLMQEVFEGTMGRREEVCNRAPLSDGQATSGGKMVHEVAVALIGRNPAGGGVRLGQKTFPFELGHGVTDGGARNAQVTRIGDGRGRDGWSGADVLLPHGRGHR